MLSENSITDFNMVSIISIANYSCNSGSACNVCVDKVHTYAHIMKIIDQLDFKKVQYEKSPITFHNRAF